MPEPPVETAMGVETPRSPGQRRDPYEGVLLAVSAAAALGAVVLLTAGLAIDDIAMADAALVLSLCAGVLLEVAARRAPAPSEAAAGGGFSLLRRLGDPSRFQEAGRQAARVGGVFAVILLFSPIGDVAPSRLAALVCAGLSLLGAGLAAVTASYLAAIDPAGFPEAEGLCRGARVSAWTLLLAAASAVLLWRGEHGAAAALHLAILAIAASGCYGLFPSDDPAKPAAPPPQGLAVLSVLGGRPNILASLLDAAQREWGIDLRSTWALTFVRRSLEPLLISLALLSWLSTGLTVVGPQEQGLVERLGVAVSGAPLPPGLHAHWPWPIDRVYRLPMQQVQSFDVGHPGDEGGGPENVLWAVEHAPDEYALLLGNGRDLVTMDASVQYRIVDAQAWRYHSSNPEDLLRAIAYRAVMRATVDKTLSDVLSENRAEFTGKLLAMVQQDADAMGLGVKIVGFLVGAMHPPVPVAQEYEAVVSAEIGKKTAVIDAAAFGNKLIPAAEAAVVTSTDAARAETLEDRGQAAGKAWSFRTLETQYHAAPGEFFFRRRLEALEKALSGRGFTVIDSRIERDGGQLWLTQ